MYTFEKVESLAWNFPNALLHPALCNYNLSSALNIFSALLNILTLWLDIKEFKEFSTTFSKFESLSEKIVSLTFD